MTDALGMLQKESHFVYSIKQPMLAEFDRSKPEGVDLQLVTKEYGFAGSLIFEKRSPLSKMFNKGIQRLRQTGTFDVIKTKWEIGKNSASKEGSNSFEVEALAARQTSLVFLVYGFVSVSTAIVLIMECCWAKVMGKKRKYQQSHHDFATTFSKSFMKRGTDGKKIQS